jgi:hypothetical protein
MKCILLLLLLAQPASKAELRQKIADLKLKAYEMQMQIDLLEKQLHDVEEAEANTPPPAAPTKAAVKTRCAGHNKDGTRCSRNAESGSRFCWQHKPRR